MNEQPTEVSKFENACACVCLALAIPFTIVALYAITLLEELA